MELRVRCVNTDALNADLLSFFRLIPPSQQNFHPFLHGNESDETLTHYTEWSQFAFQHILKILPTVTKLENFTFYSDL